jgi:acetyl-CoA C-acetyltransferase
VTVLGEVLGVGTTSFVKASPHAADVIGALAVRLALKDAELDLSAVDLIVAGSRFEHPAVGQRVLRRLGATGAAVINTENACVSGMTALQIALAHVGAGMARCAVVVGVERPSSLGPGALPLPDADPFAALGLTHPARYALEAASYCHRHDVNPSTLGGVAVKNRAHAALNDKARFTTPVTLAEVLEGPMAATPLTRLQCCANADGAAAAVVVPAGTSAGAVKVQALATRSGRLAERPQPVPLTARVAQLAYDEAGIGPEDVDVAEVYDAFSVLEVLATEQLGFAEDGTAAERVLRGQYGLGGEGLVTNPSGGLLGRGHPLGATGLAQLAEITDQLRGRCGARQVGTPRVGLVQTLGGNLRDLEANAAVVAVLSR